MKMPVESLNKITSNCSYVCEFLDKNILDEFGVFVVKSVLEKTIIDRYASLYSQYKQSDDFDRTETHLTEVRFPLDNPLAEILKETVLIKFAELLFPDGAGVYNIRIVKKDQVDVSPVFLHQDVGYQHGSFNRYSFFIPLSICREDNGGLKFIPGTHKFGYLGDAGSINESIIPKELFTVTPTAEPGDIVIMNSYTWHMSGPNVSGMDRVYFDIHINSSSDPANKILIGNSTRGEYSINYDVEYLFKNSRLQRLETYKNGEDNK